VCHRILSFFFGPRFVIVDHHLTICENPWSVGSFNRKKNELQEALQVRSSRTNQGNAVQFDFA
jgi:hypothetical protein